MVVGFITTFAISAYHHWRCEVEPSSGEFYTLQHYVIKRLVAGRQFSPGTPVSLTNKTDRDNIAEILLKLPLTTIILTPNHPVQIIVCPCVLSFSFGHCVVCPSSIYASEYPFGAFKGFLHQYINAFQQLLFHLQTTVKQDALCVFRTIRYTTLPWSTLILQTTVPSVHYLHVWYVHIKMCACLPNLNTLFYHIFWNKITASSFIITERFILQRV